MSQYFPFRDIRINQLITIYGNQLEVIPDSMCFNRKTVQANGFIIKGDVNYVITIRYPLFSCQNIVGYYVSSSKKEQVLFKNDLDVLFHIPEFNIMILKTRNKSTFDCNESINLGDINKLNNTVDGFVLDETIFVPVKEGIHYVMNMGLDISSPNTNFIMNVREIKYKQVIFQEDAITPLNMYYQYEHDSDNVVGSPIFNSKMKFIGMVEKIMNKKEMRIIPGYIIKTIVDRFFKGDYLEPFMCDIDEKDKISIVYSDEGNHCTIYGEYGCSIYDKSLKNIIPIDVWFKIHKRSNDIVKIMKGKEIIKLYHHPTRLKISSALLYQPKCSFLVKKFLCMQVIELSHEYNNLFYQHGYLLNNIMMDKIFEEDKERSYLMILSCDEMLRKKLNSENSTDLISLSEKRELDVYFLESVNDIVVRKFSDLKNISYPISMRLIGMNIVDLYITKNEVNIV